MSNNLESRVIIPNGALAEFLRTEEELSPLEFTSVLWKRLYQTGAVRNADDGSRARRKRRRDRERAKRRRSTARVSR